jgi:hypothetical protein
MDHAARHPIDGGCLRGRAPFPAVPAHDGLSHGLSWVVLFSGSQCVHTRRGCWSGFPVAPGGGGDGGSALMTAAGDAVNASGLWWKAPSATEATPAATARPPSVATMGLGRRCPSTPSCRGASCKGSIGFTLTSLRRLHSCFVGPSACIHAGVTDPRGLGCSGRRIGPRNRTWWSSSNATAIVDPVGPATAVVAAHVVPDLSGPRPAYWATWPPSSPAAPAREIAGKLVARVGYWNARWFHQLWARALRVSVLPGPAREMRN